MGIIFRYISKELYTTLFGILMVLLIIFMSNQFVIYLHYAASGHITMSAVMQLMSMQVPYLLGYLMPLAWYLCILIVFARLYMDHEMTVMSACGVSPNNLLTVVLTGGVVVTLIVGGLLLWAQPFLDTLRVKILYESVAKATVEKIMPKRFQTIGSDVVFYADDVERGKLQMHNIFFAQRAKAQAGGDRPWDITVAKTAQEFIRITAILYCFSRVFGIREHRGRPITKWCNTKNTARGLRKHRRPIRVGPAMRRPYLYGRNGIILKLPLSCIGEWPCLFLPWCCLYWLFR